MAKLHKFFLLSPTERRLLLKSTLLLAVIRLGLWLLPMSVQRSLLARLGRLSPVSSFGSTSLVDQITWAVTVAAGYVPRATCLTQALAAQALLRREGIPTDFRLGVAMDHNGKFQAHAWVERDGQVILGHFPEESYSTFNDLSWQ